LVAFNATLALEFADAASSDDCDECGSAENLDNVDCLHVVVRLHAVHGHCVVGKTHRVCTVVKLGHEAFDEFAAKDHCIVCTIVWVNQRHAIV